MEQTYEQALSQAVEILRSSLSMHTNCRGCSVPINLVYNHKSYFINPFNEADKRTYNVIGCLKCNAYTKWRVVKKKKNKISGESGECGKCKGLVVLQESSGKNRHKKKYYYTHYFKCTKCNTTYLDNKYKVMN